MPWPLPPETESGDGQAHALPGDLEMMPLCQVVGQQGGGPHRRAIPKLPRILVDDFRDQRIDDAPRGPGAATAGALREACQEVEGRGSAEASDPIVDGPAT